ncbi:DUF2062 domain-containing protein [Sphingomonas crocodyli]|uniref:DUF2062 domain-containing protein n=1 Tax=Sphingomonas crocodyli TaxID=1979270 RepID=A0A437MB30_9SPHN|nr:DUF2062 domain-containing protein [Sphingomonas crocodyli]RVT94851.1 DUF2062 domain-containing protein [Sphingomonas crocodyli]
MFARIGGWWRKHAPTRESLEEVRWLRPFAHRVLEPALWRFTRRSVPRGVALGLIVGIFLMIPGLQIIGACLLALPCRANVPIAVAGTFLSNPATTPFILYLSLIVGNHFIHSTADVGTVMVMIEQGASIGEWLGWLASSAAPALVLGLFVISVVCAAVGYLAAAFFWRWWIAHKWTLRTRQRIEAAHQRAHPDHYDEHGHHRG